MNDCELIVFVKNPVLGKVKTRLAKDLGDDTALKIYIQLLAYTKSIIEPLACKTTVWYDSEISHPDTWEGFEKALQVDGDLGKKMSDAFQVTLKSARKVIIIGSDCLELTTEIIQNAFERLNTHDFVIGPANDGGYYLLGMKALHPALFHNIAWSTSEVFSATLKTIDATRGSCHVLEQLIDIDTIEDLETSANKHLLKFT